MPSLWFGFTLLLFLEFVDSEGDNLITFFVVSIAFSSISSFIHNGTKLDFFFIYDQEQCKNIMSLPPVHIILEVIANAIIQGKEIKCIKIRKEERKLSVHRLDTYMCRKS